MNKIIELTTSPFGTPIAFEVTGITIRAATKETRGPATVNGIDVVERYNEILYKLR